MNILKTLFSPFINIKRQQEIIDFATPAKEDIDPLYVPSLHVPQDASPLINKKTITNKTCERINYVWKPKFGWSSSSSVNTKITLSNKQIVPEVMLKNIEKINKDQPIILKEDKENNHVIDKTPEYDISDTIHPFYMLYHTLLNKLEKDEDIDNYEFYCTNVSENLKPFIKKHNKLASVIDQVFTYNHIINDKQKQNSRSISCPNFDSETNPYNDNPWQPPKTYGLKNCTKIIPDYYFQTHKNINKNNILINIDYLFMIKDDIRNMRKLNQYQIDYIKSLDQDTKNDMINEFNDSCNMMIEVLSLRSRPCSRNNSILLMASRALESSYEDYPDTGINIRSKMPRTSSL